MPKVWKRLRKQLTDEQICDVVKAILGAADWAEGLCDTRLKEKVIRLKELSGDIAKTSGQLFLLLDEFTRLYFQVHHLDKPSAGWKVPKLWGLDRQANFDLFEPETIEELIRGAYAVKAGIKISKHQKARVFCESLVERCKDHRGWLLPDNFKISRPDLVALANTVLDLPLSPDGKGFTVAAMRDYEIEW